MASTDADKLRDAIETITPAHVRAVRYVGDCPCWTCRLQRTLLTAASAWEQDLRVCRWTRISMLDELIAELDDFAVSVTEHCDDQWVVGSRREIGERLRTFVGRLREANQSAAPVHDAKRESRTMLPNELEE